MYRDMELPSGFQDDDFLMRELEEKGRIASKLWKRGKCTHGWRQGKPGSGISRDNDIQKCLNCGKVATRYQLDEEARELGI